MVLEDQLKQGMKDFDEKTENLKKIRPPTAQLRHDVNLNKRYENQLNKLKVKLNDLQT